MYKIETTTTTKVVDGRWAEDKINKESVRVNLLTSASDFGFHLGNNGCQLGNDVTSGHIESSGVPINWKISYNWQICKKRKRVFF